MTTTILDRDDLELFVAFAGCSLDEKPGSNWVEQSGGLPDYICRIARAIKKTGKSTSQAIAIAVARVKKWAAGGDDVDADTRAKAAKALTEWEKLKAKAKTKRSSKTLAASTTDTAILCLAAAAEYNVDIVRTAFEGRQRELRKEYRATYPTAAYDDYTYLHVKELWTNHVIVADGYSDGRKLYKVPYTVDAKQTVSFGDPVEVKTSYVAVTNEELGDGSLSDADLKKMMELAGPCPKLPAAARLLSLSARPSALDRVMAHAERAKQLTGDDCTG